MRATVMNLRTMHRRAPMALTAWLVLGAVPLAAQATPDEVRHRDDCRLAAQIMATGRPAPHELWAADYIVHCRADAPPALASAMRALRQETDTLVLQRATGWTRFFRDARLYAAATEIAQDRGASVPARIFSLRTLYWLTSDWPANLHYGDLVTGEPYVDAGRCPVIAATGVKPTTELQLPENYRAELEALGERLSASAEEPDDVRNASWCLAVAAE